MQKYFLVMSGEYRKLRSAIINRKKKKIFFLIYCFQKGLLNIMICGNQPVCMCRLVGVDLYNLNWNISCFQVITLLYSIDIHYVINDSICG